MPSHTVAVFHYFISSRPVVPSRSSSCGRLWSERETASQDLPSPILCLADFVMTCEIENVRERGGVTGFNCTHLWVLASKQIYIFISACRIYSSTGAAAGPSFTPCETPWLVLCTHCYFSLMNYHSLIPLHNFRFVLWVSSGDSWGVLNDINCTSGSSAGSFGHTTTGAADPAAPSAEITAERGEKQGERGESSDSNMHSHNMNVYRWRGEAYCRCQHCLRPHNGRRCWQTTQKSFLLSQWPRFHG